MIRSSGFIVVVILAIIQMTCGSLKGGRTTVPLAAVSSSPGLEQTINASSEIQPMTKDEESNIEKHLEDIVKDAMQKSKVRVQPATFHNGYGTHVECTSVCVAISTAFVMLVMMVSLLLFLVPVIPPDQGESLAFLDWIDQKQEEWSARLFPRQKHGPPPSYATVAVDTDESLLVGLTYAQPLERRRSSIFSLVERKPSVYAPAGADSAQGGLLSTKEAPKEEPVTRVIKEIEQRKVIAQKAERRKERAMADVAHENLAPEEKEAYGYLEFVRELLEGLEVKKICQKSNRVVKRTFYLTPDLSLLYWTKLGVKKMLNKKSSVTSFEIERVLRGRNGTQNLSGKGQQEKDSLYVSIVTSTGKQLDLEAKDPSMRERLYHGFTRLAAEKKEEQLGIQRGEAVEERHSSGQQTAQNTNREGTQSPSRDPGNANANEETERRGSGEVVLDTQRVHLEPIGRLRESEEAG